VYFSSVNVDGTVLALAALADVVPDVVGGKTNINKINTHIWMSYYSR